MAITAASGLLRHADVPLPGRGIDLPPLNQRRFAPYKIATLIDTAADAGIAPATVLAGTDLTPDLVRDPRTLISLHDYIAACENAIAAGASAGLAYEVGARMHLSAYGMYGYALICSPTMREFLDFAVRYHLLATPILRLSWRREDDLAIWEFTEIHGAAMSRAARRFLVRQQMMMALTHVRDALDEDVRPVQALFALPADRPPEEDERNLGCPCRFDMPRHELHYPARFLDMAPHLANRLTYAWLEDTCDGMLGEVQAAAGLAGEISQLLMMRPHRRPSMEDIALAMGMSERTLRRRLTGEGIRYADLADEACKRVTLEYVRTTRMSADSIAPKVGFNDTSSLRRAIKRWTGQTFGELRRGQRRDSA